MTEVLAEGRLAEAAGMMVEGVATDEERAALSAVGLFEAWASNVRVAIQEVQQAGESTTPSPTHPSMLGRIRAPVLYLHGARTPTTWYRDGARLVASHVAHLRVIEIAGAGHFAPCLAPELIASEIQQFFTSVRSRRASAVPKAGSPRLPDEHP